MLRMLVDFFSGVVRVLAIAAVFGGALIGYMHQKNLEVEPWNGALIGFAAGFLGASVFCGLLACIILIEGHLRVLADATKSDLKKPKVVERSEQESPQDQPDRVALYARPYQPQTHPVLDQRNGREAESDESGTG